MAHQFELTVAAADLDELGHVNNARYLDFLERARTAWYGTVGLLARCAAAHGDAPLGTVVVNVNVDFLDECLAGEALTVETRGERAGGKSYRVEQTIVKADGRVAAKASVTSVVMDLATRRAIALPGAVRALFEER